MLVLYVNYFGYILCIVFPNIFASMKEPKRAEEMLHKSYVVVSIEYAVTESFGYMMFGSNTEEQITLNLPNDISGNIITILIVINAYTKYALTLHPIAVGLEEFVQNYSKAIRFLYSFVMRTLLVVGSYYVASSVPFFGYVASFIGAIFSMSISAIFPILCYLKISWFNISKCGILVNCFFIILSMCIGFIGTYSAMEGIINEGGAPSTAT